MTDRSFIARLAVTLVLLWSACSCMGQNPPTAAAPSSVQSAQVVEFLTHTIGWYRQTAVEQQLATQPSDLTFVQENRQTADQVVQLAFEYSRSQVQFLARQSAQAQGQGQSVDFGPYQRMAQAAQQTDKELQDTQDELQATRAKLADAGPAKRTVLASQVTELQGEVGLLQARSDAFKTMLEFVANSRSGNSVVGLRGQIEELARSVPAAISNPQGSGQGQSASAAPAITNNTFSGQASPTGIWGLAADLIRLSGKRHTLADEASAAKALSEEINTLREPATESLEALIRQGDQVFAAADNASPAQLAQQRKQLDAMTAQFKQFSTVLLPLGKASVLLDMYGATLANWSESVRDQFHEELRQLLLRLGLLVGLIAIVLGIGEIWRRTTFRYVHDARRRYQFLLLRRVIVWVAILIIIALSFATQLGSAVTFAGLLTAGVAVALQSVLVSVVAYFFLIGKYGIRVGDRVQIAGVNGEVVDIGLVRIHVMELGGPGDSQPTGRIVALSNSIVFQPTAGVFKQIPGTNFMWHEMKLTLAPDTDYSAAQERITHAVEEALAEDGDTMDAQKRSMEQNLSPMSMAELRPKVRFHYTATGLEADVRFPVLFDKGADTDDRLIRAVMAALDQEPKFKLLGAEMPGARTAK